MNHYHKKTILLSNGFTNKLPIAASSAFDPSTVWMEYTPAKVTYKLTAGKKPLEWVMVEGEEREYITRAFTPAEFEDFVKGLKK